MNRLGITVTISALLHLLILHGGAVPNSVTPKISVERGRTSVSLRVKRSPSKSEATDKPTQETQEKERKKKTPSRSREKRKEQKHGEPEEEPRPDTSPEMTKSGQGPEEPEEDEDDSEENRSVAPSRGPVGARMVRPAEYRRNPSPEYPTVSRRREEEGTVVLNVQVDPEGTPTSVEVKESSGHARLDRAAAQTVRDWSFTPAETGDRARGSTVRVPVRFRID